MPDPAAVAKRLVGKLRLLDRCRHFLGEVVDQRIRIYCSRCKRFLILTFNDLKQHLTRGA